MNKTLIEYLEDIVQRLDRIEKFLTETAKGIEAALESHEYKEQRIPVPKIKQVKVPLEVIKKPDFLVDDRPELEKGVVASSVLDLQGVPTGQPTQAPPSSAITALQKSKSKKRFLDEFRVPKPKEGETGVRI